MNWDKLLVLGSQVVVVIVLGVLVAMGKDSIITNALLAVSGSVTGIGLYKTVVK